MRKVPGERSECPISFALDVFGDRWTLLIVRDLMIKSKRHYGELLESDEGIATNLLADRLKWLQRAGIVDRDHDPTDRKRFVYTLTAKGRDLAPVLLEMIVWSAVHDPNTPVHPDLLRELQEDRDGCMQRWKNPQAPVGEGD